MMEEAKQIYNFILAFWKLVKKYTYNPPTKQEDWDKLLSEGEQLKRDHNTDLGSDIFHKAVILAWYDYLNYKEKRKQEV